MILSLVKYYKGYLRVRLTGFAPERFINLCSNHNILIWDLEYIDGAYEFLITVTGFRQIRPFVKKSKTRLKILNKFGLPFFLYRHRKRKVFFAGVCSFFMILYALSIFIWDIHIEGNYTYTEDVLMTYLKEQNIHHGIFRNQVNTEEIKSLLRNEYKEITWVSVSVSGTRILIQIKENYGLLTIPEKDMEPCDLVAEKDGIITEIITRNGIALVNVGDVVTKGQILVSGIVPITNDSNEVIAENYVHADATIKAKTIYEYSDSFPLLHTMKTSTGKNKTGWYIKVLDRSMIISPLQLNYEKYDTVKEEHQICLFANFYLPIYIGEVKYEEYGEYEDHYNSDEAFRIALKNLDHFSKKLEDQGVAIENRDVEAVVDQGTCTSGGWLKTIETIGHKAYIQPTEIVPETDQEQ